MNGNEILKADLLDILFNGRNKQYGAYVLRKYYNNRLVLSLSLSLSFFFLFLLLIKSGSRADSGVLPPPNVILSDYIVPKEVKPQPPQPKPAGQTERVKQRKFESQIEIVPDNRKISVIPDRKDLLTSEVSHIDADGPNEVRNTVPGPAAGGGGQEVAKTESTAGNVESVEKDPEFPGGIRNWLSFLERNLRVPGDLEAGEKKTVLIRFLVAEDGAVTSFQVMQSGGDLYDSEVIRVLRKMPKWKPAIRNGRAVSRMFTQPVTFMGIE